jgi:hemerythrin-like domain-containing protein
MGGGYRALQPRRELAVNDPMTMLKADHRDAKKLLKTLAESGEGRGREHMVKELDQALTLHMAIEEKLVYPLVAKHISRDDEEEAEVEHGLAREGLAKLTELVAKPGFGAAVEMLTGGIGHHVKEEETELLPELKASLSRQAWLQLGDGIAEAKRLAGVPVASKPRRTAKPSGTTK